ncbi:MAG: hypothetical protein E7129_06550 [Rikenellaceae bacterium]|nr:hypothetical protein [Rikenellaceae bacterium]
MKKILLSVVLATTLALTSCQFDDSALWSKLDEYGQSIKDHEQRISALEELCKQMNTNIEALQTLVDALEKRDYVTNVSEVRSNGEVIGYTISFAYSDTITIYHGQDGKDGANGADGKDGITPQLKIENDYWYVSYDNGATWVQLGKATGEDGKDGQDGNDGADGSDGADGEDGDSIFKSVTQDDEYVYFNLADGTMITLPKHDKENIQFEDLQVKAICCKNWDTNNDGELSYAEAAAVETIGTKFKGNTDIIAFTELKYFTGITEIPANAFNGCTALWKVKIPEQITSIGTYAFKGTKNLTNITIPNQMTSIGEYAFSNSSITNIFIPDNIILIENRAFESCTSLTSITIGNGVTLIGEYAFYGCSSLKSVAFGRSIISFKANCFYSCNIDTVRISDITAWCQNSFDGTESHPSQLGSNLYINGELATNLVIPQSVSSIAPFAFYNCDNIENVTISEGVVTIGTSAFEECSNLVTVDIPNSVFTIEKAAFYDSGAQLKNVYCKATIPPTIFYYYEAKSSYSSDYLLYSDKASFYLHSNLKIFVPRDSYNQYISYTTYEHSVLSQTNWSKYKSYVQPYNFQE